MRHPFTALDDHRLEASLENMPAALVPPVPPDAVSHVQPLDGSTQVGVGRAHQKMIVVAHQNRGMHLDPMPLDHLCEQIQKVPPVPIA